MLTVNLSLAIMAILAMSVFAGVPAMAQESGTSDGQTVTIGALVPITVNSETSRSGEIRATATTIAVDDFNNYLEGKGASWNVSLDMRDTLGLPDTTIDLITEMHGSNGINFVVGPSFSSNVGAVITDYIDSDTELALVSPASVSSDWALDDTVYRLAISSDKQGPVIADLLYLDGKRVIIPVWDNDPFGRSLTQSIVDEFTALGGTADYTTDPNEGTVRIYDRCSETYTTCIEDQFPEMASELAGTVAEYIRMYGSDKVAVVFVGFELADFAAESVNHPILRTVQWVGSVANVLKPSLTQDGSQIHDFLTDVDFRATTFSGSEDTERYHSLNDRLALEYPEDTPPIHAYASYDAVWAIGLAIESAGGPDSSFADVEAQISAVVNGNDVGALGDITLNESGDIESGDYAIWGIESTGWERIGTYRSDGTISTVYESDSITMGALLELGGAEGVPPTSSVFLDDEMAIVMALSKADFNRNNPDTPIDLKTVDTALGPLSAITELHHGVYDDFYEPHLMKAIEDAKATYDAEGSFDSLNGAFAGQPVSPFALNADGILVFSGTNAALKGMNAFEISFSHDRTIEELSSILAHPETDSWMPPSSLWVQTTTMNPFDPTGNPLVVRALVSYHEASGTLVGANYITPAGDDLAHMPALTATITSAAELVRSNGNDVTSLTGTYDGIFSPFYAFVIGTDGTILATGVQPTPGNSAIGANLDDIRDIDTTIDKLNDILLVDGDTAWISYTFNNPETGTAEYKRSLLMLVTLDGTDYIFGSGYYPQDQITDFVGTTTSSDLAAIQDYINDGGHVAVSPSSTATTLAQDDNVFRLSPNNRAQVPVIAGVMESAGITDVIIVQRDDVWAQDMTTEFMADNRFASYTVLDQLLPVDHTGFDYFAVVTSLESAVDSADGTVGVVHVLFPEDVVSLLRAMDRLDSASPVFSVGHYGTDGVVNIPSIIDDSVAGPMAYKIGLVGPLFSPSPNDTSTLLTERLAALGITATPYHISAYDSVSLLADAIALSSSETSVRDVLDSSPDAPFPYAGALGGTGGIILDQFGDLEVTADDYVTYVVVQADDGTYSWQPADEVFDISGTVFTDSNGNGVQDDGEQGYPGYTMYAIDIAAPDVVLETVTDDDGTYSFSLNAADRVLVQTGFFPSGHTVVDPHSSWFIRTGPGVTTFDVGFYPVPEDEFTTLELQIFLDENLNGVLDDGEGGLEGINLTVYTYTIGPEIITTDENGMITKTDLVPADWVITHLPIEYMPTVYQYTRSDPTDDKLYSSDYLVADDPEPGSVHTMLIGLGLDSNHVPLKATVLLDSESIRVTEGIFGLSIDNLGDMDGNGTDDYVLGSPGFQTGSLGAVYIVFTSPDGMMDRAVEINEESLGLSFYGADRFGKDVISMGDLDGDGVTDIAIGAPGQPIGSTTFGNVFIVFLNSDGTVKNATEISGADNAHDPVPDDRFGWSLANMGDLDGDGVNELLVAIPGEFLGPTVTIGDLHMFFLNSDGTVKNLVEIHPDDIDDLSVAPADIFASSVENIGDIDGDGITDIVISSSFSNLPGLPLSGSIHVMLLNQDGSIKDTITIDGQSQNGPSLSGFDLFGYTVTGLGDLDGDGTPDIAVGAPGFFINYVGTGDLFILYMNPDGTVKRTATIGADTPNAPSLEQNIQFAWNVTNIGDYDGDGTTDLAVSNGGNNTTSIILLNSDGTVKDAPVFDTGIEGIPLDLPTDLFGISVAGIGDLDGDGTPDIAAGAPGVLWDGTVTGELFLMFLNEDGSIKDHTTINGETPSGPLTLEMGDRFGESVANIGDLDGDGVKDIAVGAPGHALNSEVTGDLFILFMNSDGTVKNTAEINANTPNGPSLGIGDRFGESVTGLGDLDGDGVKDIAVGAPGPRFETEPPEVTGELFLMFLNEDGSVKRTITIDGTTPNGPALEIGDHFGISVANIGDHDNDGIIDIAVGAPGFLVNTVSTGNLFVLFMNSDGTIKNTAEINADTPNGPALDVGDQFGSSVANISDLDGDGVAEIAVGAPGHIVEGSAEGDLYVMYLNSDGTVKQTLEIDSSNPNGPSDLLENAQFGISVANIGDLDGDGSPEVAIGSLVASTIHIVFTAPYS